MEREKLRRRTKYNILEDSIVNSDILLDKINKNILSDDNLLELDNLIINLHSNLQIELDKRNLKPRWD